jgi:hypothetical protein
MKRNRVGILCAVLTGACCAIAQAQSQATAPNFGTSTEVWQDIPAEDFEPPLALLDTTYTSSWNPATSTFDYRRYITAGDPRLLASPHLPGGAVITSVQYDYCDTGSGSAHLWFKVYDCNFVGECDPAPLDTWGSVPGEGCVGVSHAFPAYTVSLHKIVVQVTWDNYGDTLQLAGVSFAYKLQVSPAPPTPTFGDVPLSDSGFQYIEALVASGITAGCGGGNYCPDNALTRRQMAVFLAKALGLNWSQ